MSDKESDDFLDTWSGRFILMNNEDAWWIVAEGKDRAELRLIATCESQEDALDVGFRLAGELLVNRVPRRCYLSVRNREMTQAVKKLGAAYDPAIKAWYVPEDRNESDFAAFFPDSYKKLMRDCAVIARNMAQSALPSDRLYLEVKGGTPQALHASGATFDPYRRKWFVSAQGPLQTVEKWLPEGVEVDPEVRPEGFACWPTPLRVPSEDAVLVKTYGAVALADCNRWIAPIGSYLPFFEKWTSIPVLYTPQVAAVRFLENMGLDCNRDKQSEMKVLFDGKKHRFFVEGDYNEPSGEYIFNTNSEVIIGWANNYRTKHYESLSLGISPKSYQQLLADEKEMVALEN